MAVPWQWSVVSTLLNFAATCVVCALKRDSSQLSLHSRVTAHNCLYTQETQLTTVFALKRHSSQLSLHSRDTAHNCLCTQETQLTTVFTLRRHSSQLSLHSLTIQPGVCLVVYIHNETKWSLFSINQNVLHTYCNSVFLFFASWMWQFQPAE